MEFNLDFLEQAGKALSSFGKKEEDKDYSNTSEEDQKSTAESVTPIVLKKDDDEKTIDESTTEVIKTTEDKKKESASDLEKKLANIEKVIDKFSGGTTTLPSSKDLVGNSNSNINIKPLDFGQMQAKANQQEYLKPSNVQNDRIALLYKDLEKYNLI
mgnify:FL=1